MKHVLILVIVEYALWVAETVLTGVVLDIVLILVIVEYALWGPWQGQRVQQQRLNPCYSGICSVSLSSI